MNMRPRILVTNWVHEATLQRLSLLGDVDANESRKPWPRDGVMRRAEKADAILAFMTDCIDAPFVARCKRLRVVACALKGYDNFDMDACSAAGIWVSIVPDLLTEPTAELAVGLAIGLADMAQMLARREAGAAQFETRVLSGGCFQNRVLFEEAARNLAERGFTVLSHSVVPANDGGVALGQVAVAAARMIEAGADRRKGS